MAGKESSLFFMWAGKKVVFKLMWLLEGLKGFFNAVQRCIFYFIRSSVEFPAALYQLVINYCSLKRDIKQKHLQCQYCWEATMIYRKREVQIIVVRGKLARTPHKLPRDWKGSAGLAEINGSAPTEFSGASVLPQENINQARILPGTEREAGKSKFKHF